MSVVYTYNIKENLTNINGVKQLTYMILQIEHTYNLSIARNPKHSALQRKATLQNTKASQSETNKKLLSRTVCSKRMS